VDSDKIVWLHAEAPQKPPLGAPCNGCGVCCAGEPCPVALVFLRQWRGSCRALQWHGGAKRYRCGMAQHPEHYLRWLPKWSHRAMRRLVLRWIAAETACDAKNEVDGQ
jgi:hypothetical protein